MKSDADYEKKPVLARDEIENHYYSSNFENFKKSRRKNLNKLTKSYVLRFKTC